MYGVYPNQFFCPYTMYSEQQSVSHDGLVRMYENQQNASHADLSRWYTHQMQQCFCVTFNPLDSRMTQYYPKEEPLIEKLDKLIFPIDPIRDWVESEVERISKKYAWLNEV